MTSFLGKAGKVLACAAETANDLSLAGLFGLNSDDHPIAKASLGNTFSGVVDAGSHAFSVVTGPDRGYAVAQTLTDVTLGGVAQGLNPGGGPLSQGIVGMATDTVVDGLTASEPALSLAAGGSEAAAEGLAGPIGLAKIAIDGAIFAGSFVYCATKH